MDDVRLCEGVLCVEECTRLVTSPTCGAVSLFLGTTRNNFNGKTVLRLEYEAYGPMAVKEMKKICSLLRGKWPEIEGIAIHHRLGEVPVGEASVIIAVASPHRQASLEAVHLAIDTLKATVPIWKREVYADGTEWKQNCECAWGRTK